MAARMLVCDQPLIVLSKQAGYSFVLLPNGHKVYVISHFVRDASQASPSAAQSNDRVPENRLPIPPAIADARQSDPTQAKNQTDTQSIPGNPQPKPGPANSYPDNSQPQQDSIGQTRNNQAGNTKPARKSGAKGLKEIKLRGYVTAVNSPTNFEIEDYRIFSDEEFSLELENASPELQFHKEDIRVGVELEIRGLFDDEAGELTAKSVKVDLEQFKKIKQTAVLSTQPVGIERNDQGWSGTFFVDGQQIRVLPRTAVLFKKTSREKQRVEKQKKNQLNPQQDADSQAEFRPLSSLAEISPGFLMTYEGSRSREDGVIVADRVEFSRNDLEKGEAKVQKSVEAKTKPWNALQLKPGELKIKQVGKYQLVPSDEIQQYVRQLGESLMPQYYKDLPDGDPSKLRFQFFVVKQKEMNAFALANGVIVVNSGVFRFVENEAQLAFLLGHEIEHAIQEHTWRQMQYHKKKLMALRLGGIFASSMGYGDIGNLANMIEGAVRAGYSRNLENQSDRLGLELMVQGGYDPREAPRMWKVMAQKTGDHRTSLFDAHDNHSTRRSYLMNELKNNYANLDYSKVSKGSDRFHEIASLLEHVSSQKRKVRVK